MDYTEADAETLATKMAAMELTDGEAAALIELLARADQGEVGGYQQFEIQVGATKLLPQTVRVGVRRALGVWETLPAEMQ